MQSVTLARIHEQARTQQSKAQNTEQFFVERRLSLDNADRRGMAGEPIGKRRAAEPVGRRGQALQRQGGDANHDHGVVVFDAERSYTKQTVVKFAFNSIP
jgi:hypothetical protein